MVLAASYLGFLAATSLGHGWSAPAVATVSVVCTIGEIIYAGSATALVTALAPAHLLGRALARFQLSTGFGLAVSPAVITALASRGSAALWGSLAAATLLSASAVATEKDQGTHDLTDIESRRDSQAPAAFESGRRNSGHVALMRAAGATQRAHPRGR
ncbi:hypothetical protein [Microtetraspora malaysiensis]|uniref:hypothetical protein n=1 Tax=Microtetraspora malaysiensis TaxID=161358 RepID=UPI001C3F24FC|nr:hypothetical protein [Microtetraspora malaysiensis]